MDLPRGYGLARATFESKPNLSFYTPKPYQILCKEAKTELEEKIIEELFLATESGALCLDLEFFQNKFPSLLSNSSIQKETLESLESKNIIFVNNKFYFKNTYNAETRIAEKISFLLTSKNSSSPDLLVPNDFLYSEEQKQAVKNVLNQSFSIITGGPGTGKTTLIQFILFNLIQNGYSPKKIGLASPTGKAAKRLLESLKSLEDLEPPTTLHRLLGYNPSIGKFFYNEENPLALDVILIDESSMMDLYILDALLNALLFTPKLKLILIGDPDQLLSVNKGAIFSDLVELNINTSRITKTYRQKQEDEDLIGLIQSIREEQSSFLEKCKLSFIQNSSASVKWIELENEEEFFSHIAVWYEIYKTSNSQILTPYNRGTLGVSEINKFLHEKFPQFSPRILNTNLPNLQLFNGETGFILEKNGNYIFSKNFESNAGVVLPYYVLRFFSLAYAITIHKSQGSEYEHILLVLPPNDKSVPKEELLTKRLLYTAVTRAKKSVTILGSFATWERAVHNLGYPRMSGLKERLKLLKK
ncbi:MAG: AAA family ATPase [Leptospiraceae bacterium]|nr:AAA family ATPase [Leptospiraceae bacterium]